MAEIVTEQPAKPGRTLISTKVPFGAVRLARNIILKTYGTQRHKKCSPEEALSNVLSRQGMQKAISPKPSLRQQYIIELVSKSQQSERRIMWKCIMSTYQEYIRDKGDGSTEISFSAPNQLTERFIDLCNTAKML